MIVAKRTRVRTGLAVILAGFAADTLSDGLHDTDRTDKTITDILDWIAENA